MKKLVYLFVFTLLPLSCQQISQEPGGAILPNPDAPELIDLNTTATVAPASPPAVITRLDNYFYRKSKYAGFNGTVLFGEQGEIRYAKAYGYSNLRGRDSLDVNSSFELASVSKPITAIATLMLVDKGQLSLADSLEVIFPEFPYKGITIEMLLSHRSGLPNYMYFSDSLWEDKEGAITNRDVLDLMIRFHPQRYYPPDRRYNYSNTNYALLALIVEEVSDMAFDLFVKTKIFLPLEMHHSQVYNKSVTPLNYHDVKGHVGYRRLAENTYLNGVVGDKGIYSSVTDLFKLDEGLRTGKLLSEETLKLAYQPMHEDLYKWDNYGLGWRIDASDPENKVVYHTGWWKGFRSYFIRELGTDRTIIVLSNTARNSYIGSRELRRLIQS